MFEAISEDAKSKDDVLGEGAYKNSPAYKYASLIDQKDNFLYWPIIELRKLIDEYIKYYNSQSKRRFSLKDLDLKFLQTHEKKLEQIKYSFVYGMEYIKKYNNEISYLPENDFYKTKNANFFFFLCLIIEAILKTRFEGKFRRYVRNGRRKDKDMTFCDGVVLLFERKGWITKLSSGERKDPRGSLSITPSIPKNDPDILIDKYFTNPITLKRKGAALPSKRDYEMRVMLLALKLRNYTAHNIQKEEVFLKKFPEIVQWLTSAMFVAISSLSKDNISKGIRQKKFGIPQTTIAFSTPVATSNYTDIVTNIPPNTLTTESAYFTNNQPSD